MPDKDILILIDALKSISLYVFPIYTFDNHQYVKLEHAKELREFAKEALAEYNADIH